MRKIGAVLLVALLIPAGVGGAFLYFNSPPVSRADSALFQVERGEALTRIAARLQEAGLIRSARFLKLLSRLWRTGSSFQSGFFRIPPGATTVDVHNLLVSGRQEQVRVTIPEGWTIGKIARRVEELGLCSRQEFLAAAASPVLLERLKVPGRSLEGYLFPDTYYVPPGSPAEALVGLLADNFFTQLESIAPESRELTPAQLHQKVIMASIVEREYRVATDAPKIASVFYNRLHYNIGLESCATLEYIITEIQGKEHPDYITKEDKNIDSVYNTYKWAGLPPGPISSPGRVALDAAFHPAASDFFYFVLKDPSKGEHFFSRSLTQHNEAKVLYLKK